jgi:hypothetical protein
MDLLSRLPYTTLSSLSFKPTRVITPKNVYYDDYSFPAFLTQLCRDLSGFSFKPTRVITPNVTVATSLISVNTKIHDELLYSGKE